MLGNALYEELRSKYDLVLSLRDIQKISLLEDKYRDTAGRTVIEFDAAKVYADFVERKGYPGVYLSDFAQKVSNIDYVINAIGVTIPFSQKDPVMTFFINGALPHILARTFGAKLIHITTDCVYSGKDGFLYDETSPKTAVDIYGLSKSLGEPAECLTLRTSIIGRELENFTGLLEWFLQQKGKTISGFTGHMWNGITTNEFAHVCDRIMSSPEKFPRTGFYHLFSNPVSKYEMLLAFRDKFKLDCEIIPEHENKLNRTMGTVREMNGLLNVPSFTEMINALRA